MKKNQTIENLLKNIFSITNSKDKIHKTIIIFGIKINIKSKLLKFKQTIEYQNSKIEVLANSFQKMVTEQISQNRQFENYFKKQIDFQNAKIENFFNNVRNIMQNQNNELTLLKNTSEEKFININKKQISLENKYNTKKNKTVILGENNKIIIITENKEEIILRENETIAGLDINIKGNNNIIKLKKPFNFSNCRLLCNGNNNSMNIEPSDKLFINTYFDFGQVLSNRRIFIDENVFLNGLNFRMWTNGSQIIVGKNCMLSWNVELMTGDAHQIYDRNTGVLLSKSCNKILINDNCWVGANSTILKNVEIAEGCIIGANSVVTKSLLDKHSIYAGNPVRKIKEDVNWDYSSEI